MVPGRLNGQAAATRIIVALGTITTLVGSPLSTASYPQQEQR